jgi:hypothetical protein
MRRIASRIALREPDLPLDLAILMLWHGPCY